MLKLIPSVSLCVLNLACCSDNPPKALCEALLKPDVYLPLNKSIPAANNFIQKGVGMAHISNWSSCFNPKITIFSLYSESFLLANSLKPTGPIQFLWRTSSVLLKGDFNIHVSDSLLKLFLSNTDTLGLGPSSYPQWWKPTRSCPDPWCFRPGCLNLFLSFIWSIFILFHGGGMDTWMVALWN